MLRFCVDPRMAVAPINRVRLASSDTISVLGGSTTLSFFTPIRL